MSYFVTFKDKILSTSLFDTVEEAVANIEIVSNEDESESYSLYGLLQKYQKEHPELIEITERLIVKLEEIKEVLIKVRKRQEKEEINELFDENGNYKGDFGA